MLKGLWARQAVVDIVVRLVRTFCHDARRVDLRGLDAAAENTRVLRLQRDLKDELVKLAWACIKADSNG